MWKRGLIKKETKSRKKEIVSHPLNHQLVPCPKRWNIITGYCCGRTVIQWTLCWQIQLCRVIYREYRLLSSSPNKYEICNCKWFTTFACISHWFQLKVDGGTVVSSPKKSWIGIGYCPRTNNIQRPSWNFFATFFLPSTYLPPTFFPFLPWLSSL